MDVLFCICRKHQDDKFEPFTPSQKSFVNNVIINTLSYLRKNLNQTYSIEDYVDKDHS